MMHFKLKFLLAIVCGFALSCQDNEIGKQEKDRTSHDSIFAEYPYYKVRKASEELNISKLENGVDSFELRLWIEIAPTNGGEVFVIKKLNSKWSCLHYHYIENWSGADGKDFNLEFLVGFEIDTFWVEKKTPISGWDTFFEKLNKQRIFDLPSQTEIEGWENIVSDGLSFIVEFASKDNYRLYSYHCPDVCEDEFEDCRHMSNILSIFYQELGLTELREDFRCSR